MTRTTFTILFLLFHLALKGQEIVRQEDYRDFKFGIYKTKSIATEIIKSEQNVIDPQTTFNDGEKTAFLKVGNQSIALYDQIDDLGIHKPVGLLKKSSIIQVDTIFYQEIYKDTTKSWSLTFNVWYAIKINGEEYYTDYKIHDFIGFKKELDKYNQELLIVAQSTGYDDYYDMGYPNYFFVAVINSKKELIFESKILDFDYGDEFWEPEFVDTRYVEKGVEFTINGFETEYKAVWTGAQLKEL